MKIALWGSTPLPWYVCWEFVRQTWAGFIATFGPYRPHAPTMPYNPKSLAKPFAVIAGPSYKNPSGLRTEEPSGLRKTR